MINNKKGSILMGLIFAGFFFFIGILMLPFMKDSVTDARSSLDCTNSSISDGQKTTCLLTDATLPYFIIAILIFIGGIVGNEL